MPNDFQPSRQKTDLAEVVEMLLDKGIVINADIAVSIGDTQLLGVQVRAAIASFETAAKYGLEFPEGTDMRRVAEAVGEPELAEMDRPNPVIDATRGVNVTPDERYVDGERLEDEETEEVEASSTDGGDGGDSTFTTPDRGSERLGARPDPEQPTSGGFDLISDDEDEADGSNEVEEDDAEDEQHDEEAAAQTEEN
ncbi:gas vesicle protein GvpJ [Natronobacterium texcoconense]|uniref:Gas vesicle protein n=1 Tax=Natronobacterium texcoconense TaxID=1095778 RepID=A0A1H1G8F6_NATTX|nr:gas vesicle protein [Natronobacterium texcoconense]SDR09470.1 Gas vesicle protein [Natronobacterium texcoconense]